MNPFSAMNSVLAAAVSGDEITATLPDGKVLSSLKGEGPNWKCEAEMVVSGNAPVGVQDPLVRRVIMPMVRASRLLGDETNLRRFAQARTVLQSCGAEDWRAVCLAWVDLLEREPCSP
jgi:hypothetical protein